MFVRIDHVMICVPDLAAGIEQYRNLGFSMHAGGMHPGKGTHNAIAFNRDDYIELLALHDRAEYERASESLRRDDGALPGFLAAGGGIAFIAGLALGVLHGVIDGVIDPFRLLFLIAKVVVVAAQVVGRVVQAVTDVVAPELDVIGTTAREAIGVPTAPAALPDQRAPPAAVADVAPGEVSDAQVVGALSTATTTETVAVIDASGAV